MTYLQQFIRSTDGLVQFDAEFDEALISGTSIYSLEVHRDEMKSIWEGIKTVYEKCLTEINNKNGTADGETVDAIDQETITSRYQSAYTVYVRFISRLGARIHELSVPRPETYSPRNSTPQPWSAHVHLPPCDVDVFDSTYHSWPTFRDLFTALYINRPGLSKIEKLFHLNRLTSGDAKNIVQRCPPTEAGFDLAWQDLKERFENKRKLVFHQLGALFNLPRIPHESGEEIKNLQRQINSCASALNLYNISSERSDLMFVFVSLTRLPETTLAIWEQSLTNKKEIPTWSQINDFLSNRFQTLETISDVRGLSTNTFSSFNFPNKIRDQNTKQKSRINSNHATISGNASYQCRICPTYQHPLRKCPKFLQMNVDERIALIKEYNLCLNCLAGEHYLRDCTSSFNCRTCRKRHNTLIHRENIQTSPVPTINTNSELSLESSTATNIRSCVALNSKSILLATAMVKIHHNGVQFPARAFFDSGSEGTFISERLFKRIGLRFKSVNAQTIGGLNGSISAQSRKMCRLVVSSNGYTENKVEIDALVLKDLSGNLPSREIDPNIIERIPNLTLADPQFYKNSEVDILIGEDTIDKVELDGFKRNIYGRLRAKETIFGWVLSGNLEESSSSPNKILSCASKVSLEKQLTRFWEVEDVPQKPIISPGDRYCEDLYARTTQRQEDGRYIVSLPFKKSFLDGIEHLGYSRKIALSQFLRNEARLSKNLQQKLIYDSVVQEYLDLGHMNKISSPTSGDNFENYYLPHHAVVKPESSTTKVRVVFNASCSTSNGISLNDVLHPGPVLQNDLIILLLKWRFHRYVFNCDIEKMYRQILVNPNDTPFQRILFRNSKNEEIQDYELKTVTFGVNCAPYLAIRTLIQLASDVKESYPLASEILKNFMYVDDALYGTPDVSTATQARDQLIEALGSAGFNLRKWTSNSPEVLQGIPKNHLLQEDFCEFEDTSNAKTLGIRWNAKSDIFYFSARALSNRKNITKRQVLSEISKLFDPAGWLSPFIILSKILMRKIWESKSEWDEVLLDDCLHDWNLFVQNYPDIVKIKIPRWVSFNPKCKIEIHGFCDASEKAYAAALYVRIIVKDSISVKLLTAKSKVAPVKCISLPRLELCGAVLLAKLIESILPSLNILEYSLYKWSDSTIVLSWLQKSPSHWKTFVANRVSKILQTIGCDNWFHVSSQFNPADIATRGSYPSDLAENELWWNGPAWLKLPSSKWPKSSLNNLETDEEEKPIRVNFTYFSNYDEVLDRFSKFPTAIRTLCYVFRFFKRTHPKYRNSFQYETTSISHDEITYVRNRLILIAQKVAYPQEYKAIKNGENIHKSSSLLNLNPFLDSNKLLRVNGRLANSPSLCYDEKFPVILPYNCHFSKLLVQFSHILSLHGGNQQVLRLVRMQYWIPKLKNLIKTTIHNCKQCVLHKAKVRTQIMSALPPERTELQRPFYNTGIDFAGPFDLKSFTGRACRITKGYVCVFVCFATKAIHLEATTDLSTPAFIAAFNRFTARRGYPFSLYSDNGTTFVGASRQMAKEFLITSRSQLISDFTYQNIQWHFIPPGAPHMGGLWEAGVKSFKTHFRKIASSFKYTFEEFSTLLAKIECCLNSRPISPMSEDPMDLNALTPGHFLIGSPLLAPPDPKIENQPMSIINRWQRLRAIQQQFCQRWKNEYLKELHKRNKWKISEENITVGTMVVIKDDNIPINDWRLGRISQVYTGPDDKVRVADIITQRGTITRPIVKLVALPA